MKGRKRPAPREWHLREETDKEKPLTPSHDHEIDQSSRQRVMLLAQGYRSKKAKHLRVEHERYE